MVTFLIILAAIFILAICIGIVILIVLALGGATLGILVYIFGDLIIGIALTALLIRAIFKRRR